MTSQSGALEFFLVFRVFLFSSLQQQSYFVFHQLKDVGTVFIKTKPLIDRLYAMADGIILKSGQK